MAKKSSPKSKPESGVKIPSTRSAPGPGPSGGETHQVAGGGEVLTTQQGIPVADDQNTATAGARGPQLLEDFVMREKIFHFDHERIPERVVHARGYGVKGYFETYESLSELTSADLFQRAGERTEVFARLSTVAGSAGSMDLARDVRGFAVKFYTKEGNWDLVGNNMPVFFIQDAMKFPDLVHAVKAEPDRGFPQAQSAHDTLWDFISLMPESMHMVMWIMSDRAIPRSLRFMEGFGVHTFRFIDDTGDSTYVKFHWKPVLGTQSVLWDEAVKINGADPDFHRRDMWNTIDQGHPAEWELGVQTFDDAFADSFEFDVLDATKLIPEEIIPVRPVGRMVLNQNVDNFFAETEQVAFCTANVVRGIDFTNDPLLQGRNFSYLDTQLKRLGSPNFTHIPVNAPRCPVANFQRDGHMMATAPPTGRANYEPNSWSDGGPREDPERGFTSFPEAIEGDKRRTRPESFADHFSQARQFYVSQQPVEQQHLTDALVFELSKVKTTAIQQRMVGQLRNIDDGLAQAVSDGLGFEELPTRIEPAVEAVDLDPSPALSMLANPPGTFAGRRFGALVCDGADAKAIRALRRAVKNHQASLALIAPSIHGIRDSDGKTLEIDEAVKGGPSVLFDAVAIVLTADGATAMSKEPAARDFVTDAHAHAKFVGMGPNAKTLLDAAGVDESMRDDGYLDLASTNKSADALLDACCDLRFWDRV